MKSGVIKPGEIRILRALMNEPLSDKEIRGKARLVGANVRIRYLRHLWKQGLITRDIDSRKYSIADKGREMLRLVDRMKTLLEEKEVVDFSARAV